MSHVIDKARTKQRFLVITLLDLKIAFGEIHHNLIKSLLSYHYIPSHVQALISNKKTTRLYCNVLKIRSGARGGLEGAIAPCRNMLPPHRKVKNYFVGDFWHLQHFESRILALSSEESAPLSENSWRHPCSRLQSHFNIYLPT